MTIVAPTAAGSVSTIHDVAASSPGIWNELGGATLKLAALFWLSVLITDSILWGVAGTDPVESAIGKLVLNSFGALLTIVVTALLFRFRRANLLTKAVLAFAFSLIAAPVYGLFDYAVHQWWVWPVMLEFSMTNFGYTLVSSAAMFFGWSCLYVSLIYSFEVRDRERSLAAAREEALAAQMRALRYQVNPHFLFNTLNSIAGLIEEGAATRAERMVLSLSTFLRTTLALDPMHDVTLADELTLQEDYLDIELERFSDRMSFSIDAPDDIRQGLVPTLILQPLVENAVKHGVGRSSEPIGIRIIARRNAERLSIVVDNDVRRDDGDVAPEGFGIGLRNVADRIRTRFGSEGGFTTTVHEGAVYRAEIELPWRTA